METQLLPVREGSSQQEFRLGWDVVAGCRSLPGRDCVAVGQSVTAWTDAW